MFVKKDSTGTIVSVSQVKMIEVDQFMQNDDPELQEFLNSNKAEDKLELDKSDSSMARVLEDVINLLVDQGVIRFTDLPHAAQTKLISRKNLRGQIKSVDLLENESDLQL
jgi:predicted RNA-binding protein